MSKHVVAILDTMWGSEPGEAPRYFKINLNNHSGRRLYTLVGEGVLLTVTNSCRELVTHANQHGKPDPSWLADSLHIIQRMRHIDLLLVCGKVAQKTYRATGHVMSHARVIEMPHPAARFVWTADLLAETRAKLMLD